MRVNWGVWISVGALIVLGIAYQVVHVYGGIHHPYLAVAFLLCFGIALLVIGALAETPEGKWDKVAHKVVNGIGEALVVVAAVVVLFELPDFKEFYESSVRQILTTRAYVEKLSDGEQRSIVEAVVAERLGSLRDSTVTEAFARDLLQQIEEGQYVVAEDRYFEKAWVRPDRDSSRAENRMTRQAQVFGRRATHRLDDVVGGHFDYLGNCRSDPMSGIWKYWR